MKPENQELGCGVRGFRGQQHVNAHPSQPERSEGSADPSRTCHPERSEGSAVLRLSFCGFLREIREIRRLLLVSVVSAACVKPMPAARPAGIIRSDQTSGTNALLIAVSPVNERVVWVSGS